MFGAKQGTRFKIRHVDLISERVTFPCLTFRARLCSVCENLSLSTSRLIRFTA
jgi:hypothetical protein